MAISFIPPITWIILIILIDSSDQSNRCGKSTVIWTKIKRLEVIARGSASQIKVKCLWNQATLTLMICGIDEETISITSAPYARTLKGNLKLKYAHMHNWKYKHVRIHVRFRRHILCIMRAASWWKHCIFDVMSIFICWTMVKYHVTHSRHSLEIYQVSFFKKTSIERHIRFRNILS